MNKYVSIKQKSKQEFCLWFLRRRIFKIFPDKVYIVMKYRCIMGRWPKLKNPQYLSEKIQWLKLYDRNNVYPKLVDKFAVRNYISNTIGDEFLVPLIGVWKSPKEIKWDTLPHKFVLKCNNGSHTNIICENKDTLDKEKAINQLNKWLTSNQTFYYGREWPYKMVEPLIIAEEYIESTNPGGIVDYKFMCFQGQVDHVMICSDRKIGDTKFDHFDRNWKFLRYQYVDNIKPEGYSYKRPDKMDLMFSIAEKLAKPFLFVRVDLYCENNKVYFGELTFYPQSGFDTDYTFETDLYFGNKLILPHEKGEIK